MTKSRLLELLSSYPDDSHIFFGFSRDNAFLVPKTAEDVILTSHIFGVKSSKDMGMTEEHNFIILFGKS